MVPNESYRWYISQLESRLPARTRRVFEDYVGLKPEEVELHITRVVSIRRLGDSDFRV